MKILIIGGSRFSGKQLLLKLAAHEHEITVINRGIHPIDYPANCTHVAMDRNDEVNMRTFLKDKSFDWVFDFIAWRGPETVQIISMLEGKIQKFVHISTVDVYDLARINNYPTLPIFEADPIGPITENEQPYPRGKRLCEQYLLEAFQNTGFPVVILRPTYIYGPDNYYYKEAYYFNRIRLKLPLYTQSPPHIFFDMIHAEDLADLCILAAQSSHSEGQAYNATCGEFITSSQLADLVTEWSGQPSQNVYYLAQDLETLAWPQDLPLWPYEYPVAMTFSNQKAATELGFSPKFRLREGLKQTYDWFCGLTEEEIQHLWERFFYPKKWEEKLQDYFMKSRIP